MLHEPTVGQCARLLQDHGIDNLTSSPNWWWNISDDTCTDVIPSSYHVFKLQSAGATLGVTVATLLCALVLALYVEQAIFIHHNFASYSRRSKTLVVIGIYPVFSVTSLLGFMLPRAGTLVDFVANIYLSVCILYAMRLLLDYFGGLKVARNVLEGVSMSLRAPPCCCCCVCLPQLTYTRTLSTKLYIAVMQVAIVRPLLMFIAAVLWVDGAYVPGVISTRNAYIYITVINLISSMSAIYALMILRNTFTGPLQQFAIGGKLLCLQLVIILSVLFNLIINILVQNDVIACDELFSSKARGERIFHLTMICLMVPLAVLGRMNYRRAADGSSVADRSHVTSVNITSADMQLEDKPHHDLDTNGHNTWDSNRNEKS